MIRLSTPDDAAAVTDIWRASFDDSAEYIRFFLQNRFSAGRCLLEVQDGRPVAMLHLFGARCFGGAEESALGTAQYVYAAATRPEYRGRGVMARLLAEAEREGERAGCRFTFLLPGSAGLYDYYTRLGYRAAFSIRKAEVSRTQISAVAEGRHIHSGGNPDYAEIFRRRALRFRPGVLWNAPELRYALDEWRYTGGEILCSGGEYVLCREEAGEVIVRESSGPLAVTAALLLGRYSAQRFVFFLPPSEPGSLSSAPARYGMLKPVPGAEAFCEAFAARQPYVNLLLD